MDPAGSELADFTGTDTDPAGSDPVLAGSELVPADPATAGTDPTGSEPVPADPAVALSDPTDSDLGLAHLAGTGLDPAGSELVPAVPTQILHDLNGYLQILQSPTKILQDLDIDTRFIFVRYRIDSNACDLAAK